MSAAVTEPGVFELTAAEYHADPVPGGSLSSSGARKLLPPSCPALYRHWADNPPEPRDYFDFGSAAHRLVLGAGEEIAEIEADNWKSPKRREEADEHRAAGRIPLLSKDVATVHEMAAVVRAHPIASVLFAPGSGVPEQALVWQERAAWFEDVDGEPVGRSGWVNCRALVDWLPNPQPGRRLLLADYKTTASASPDDAAKAIARYGYHVQGAWYLAGLRALGLADESAKFLLVMQEKTAPYLVTVIEPDRDAMRLGAMRMREAINTYAECQSTGRWPGYSDDVVIAELPRWETRELDGVVW
ncbi:PD-(D/E)XK nuclease-like domain-containing protein [Actinoplanes lobatus]|uniref:Putative exodeoxyribonuclease 8 PDDEXK-like domain-containing protein n=1 Tax=Actinoplanes lobatus TaxID=113568 RepID=A0A7W7MM07_9ACTN|nr:PD-(D/E)XK nuclease-like domain-containing protein [Actinoplanes lobatus]MBB4755329.1 hypothetical protein [Actinoplanes lobatus]GIE46387.1 hypothetical protein Alo02nite_92850 [Actinoplanes lobatus]